MDTSEKRSEIPGKFLNVCWRRIEKISVRNEEVL
jgi:hypothetical protein